MTLGEYAQEVVDYLCKKLPDINPATIVEIAEFVTAKASNYAQDDIKKNNQSWFGGMKRHDEFYLELMKKGK